MPAVIRFGVPQAGKGLMLCPAWGVFFELHCDRPLAFQLHGIAQCLAHQRMRSARGLGRVAGRQLREKLCAGGHRGKAMHDGGRRADDDCVKRAGHPALRFLILRLIRCLQHGARHRRQLALAEWIHLFAEARKALSTLH